MTKPNLLWNPMCRWVEYPSGQCAVTDQGLYSSHESMREWSATFLCAAIAWMIWGKRRWFTREVAS